MRAGAIHRPRAAGTGGESGRQTLDLLTGAFEYAQRNPRFFWNSLETHLVLSFSALALALLVAIPSGIAAARSRALASLALNLTNAFRVIPSLAILFLAYPYLGLGFRPALVAITVLAIPPILINTYAGFRAVPPEILEAARGMGMNAGEILRRVEFPLALPVIMAGLRTAGVEVIASATLAAFIGGGGLGDFILRGFALYDAQVMLAGAIPVALLALSAEGLLGLVQRRLTASVRPA